MPSGMLPENASAAAAPNVSAAKATAMAARRAVQVARAARAAALTMASTHSDNGCGFHVECMQNYSAHQINVSVSAWNPFDINWRRRFNQRRLQAESECKNGVLTTAGAWCLPEDVHFVELPRKESYMIAPEHVQADQGLAMIFLAMFSPMGESLCLTGRGTSWHVNRTDYCEGLGQAWRATVNNFGAGVGQYGHLLRSLDPGVLWMPYDGAGNVETYTKGYVSWFDLSIPLSLPRADWVVSLEVREHVLAAFEQMCIRNLHAHNCQGVILSWAVLNQPGVAHINNHRNEYIIDIFQQLGYFYRHNLVGRFRRNVKYPWFKQSVMAFQRHQPLAECASLSGHIRV